MSSSHMYIITEAQIPGHLTQSHQENIPYHSAHYCVFGCHIPNTLQKTTYNVHDLVFLLLWLINIEQLLNLHTALSLNLN